MSTNQSRSSVWSITINNPTDSDLKVDLPAGWKLTGQIEKGSEGTTHYQGMLKTNQVRFSAVKKVFVRAHIEPAKNAKALEKYVHKEDTRVSTVEDRVSNIPTLFEYQVTIAKRWDESEWDEFKAKAIESDEKLVLNLGEVALRYIDCLVEVDIQNGVRGVEFIAINPMWRSAWKRFWRSMVDRETNARLAVSDRQTDEFIPDHPTDSSDGENDE